MGRTGRCHTGDGGRGPPRLPFGSACPGSRCPVVPDTPPELPSRGGSRALPDVGLNSVPRGRLGCSSELGAARSAGTRGGGSGAGCGVRGADSPAAPRGHPWCSTARALCWQERGPLPRRLRAGPRVPIPGQGCSLELAWQGLCKVCRGRQPREGRWGLGRREGGTRRPPGLLTPHVDETASPSPGEVSSGGLRTPNSPKARCSPTD